MPTLNEELKWAKDSEIWWATEHGVLHLVPGSDEGKMWSHGYEKIDWKNPKVIMGRIFHRRRLIVVYGRSSRPLHYDATVNRLCEVYKGYKVTVVGERGLIYPP